MTVTLESQAGWLCVFVGVNYETELRHVLLVVTTYCAGYRFELLKDNMPLTVHILMW